jgi:hypothetical protein
MFALEIRRKNSGYLLRHVEIHWDALLGEAVFFF